jgi:cytochrome c biogenesis protein CcdA/thiol-disulfide isomerase/thioredoxin
MGWLIGIGLLAGIGTAVSPCVLPVLPVLLAGGAAGRKPLRIVSGLVLSFATFTLFATWLLDKLGLPQDLLRNLGLAFLFLTAIVLLVPQAAMLVERSLAVFSRLRPANPGGGFLLGVSLGLVFVPCAGPFLAAITTAAARHQFGTDAVVTTIAYSIGAAIPMLLIAYGGRETAGRLRTGAPVIRTAAGVLVAVVAVGLVFHVDDRLAKVSAPWTTWLQKHVEASGSAQRELRKVSGEGPALTARADARGGGLPDYGAAPQLRPGGAWINSKPLTISGLRGKVVLVDFWTYSCINCLRTLPHLEAWYAAYHPKGLVIVGVHTPEFAFEHVTSNVRAAVKRLGIEYPVVQDNDYKTWDNYANQYWPAEYLIDRTGRIRHTNFGEGDYGGTEEVIRQLLGATGARAKTVANQTPTEIMTPESYLGYARLQNYVGKTPVPDKEATYAFPASVPVNTLSYSGNWTVGSESIRSGANARLRLNFEARDVYLVLGGRGTVTATIDGKPAGAIRVNGQRLYTVRSSPDWKQALLELRFSPGIAAYSFTFG